MELYETHETQETHETPCVDSDSSRGVDSCSSSSLIEKDSGTNWCCRIQEELKWLQGQLCILLSY
jgi:hypothetical protein